MLSPPHHPEESFVRRRLESDSIKSSDIGGTLCRVTRIIEKLKILKISGHGVRRRARWGRNLILRLNHSLHSTTYHITSITLD